MRLFTLVILLFAGVSGWAQKGLVINEFSQGGTSSSNSREYIELVVVGTRLCGDTTADLRNWIVDDNNGWYGGAGSGIATGHFRFKNIANWQAVPIGSILLLYNGDDKNASITLADDPTDANNDNVYVIDVTNTTYLEANTTFPSSPSSPTFTYPTTGYLSTATSNDWTARIGLANNGDAIITVAPGTLTSAFHSIAYNLQGGSAFQTPTIAMGAVGSQTAAWLTNGSYTNASSYSIGSVATAGNETPGAVNTTANATWIAGLRTTTLTTVTATGTNATCNSGGSIAFANLCPGKTYTLNYTLNGTALPAVTVTANASGTAVWSNLIPGTYGALTLTAPGQSVNSPANVTLFGAATPVITASVGQTPTNCGSSDATIVIPGLSANTVYSYSYTLGITVTGSGTANASGSLTIPNLTAGTYTNIFITTAGCSSNSVSVTINPGPLSGLTTSVTQPTQCTPSNGSIAINNLPSAAPATYTYTYNGTAGSGSGNISAAGTLVLSNLAPGTYTNLVITATGCSSAALGPFTLTAPGSPSIITPIITNPTTCGGTNGSLQFSGLSGSTSYTYQYTLNGTTVTNTASTSAAGQLVLSGLAAGSYTNLRVSLAGNSCFSNTIAGPVVLNNPPFPATTVTTTNPTTCGGTNGSFSIGGLVANTAYSAAIAATTGGTTTNTTVSATANSTGVATWNGYGAGTSVSVVLSGPNGCTSGTLTAGPFANPAAPTVAAASNSPVCQGGTLNLTATSATGTSFAWTGPNGYTATGATPSIPNVQPAAAGTYTVTATAASTNCTSAPATVSVVITPLPAAPTASSNSPVCSGSTLNLTASTISGATYSWTGPGGYTAAVQNPTLPNAGAAAAGTYSVTATVGGCTSPAGTTSVAITPAPAVATATGTNPASCGGTNGSILLTGLPALTSVTIAYTRNGTAQTVTATTSAGGSVTLTGLGTGTYTAFAVTASGCTGAASGLSVILTNPSAPAAPTATANGPLCAGATLNLSASTVAGATYTWNGPNGFSSTQQSPSIANAPAAASGTYAVTATVAGCSSPAGTVVVTVNPVPAAPVAGSNSPLCAGSTLNLTASSVTGASYSWTGPGGYSSTAQNPAVAAAPVSASGTYSVTATVAGCTSPAATTTVVVNPVATLTVASSTSPLSCGGTTGSITLGGVASGTTYTIAYSKNGTLQTAVVQTASAGSVTLSGLGAGSYSAFSVTAAGCTSTLAGPVVLADPAAPAAPTLTSNSPICAGSTLSVMASAVTGATYSWTGPNGYTATTQSVSIPNATTAASGTYSVTATVAGCTSAPAAASVLVNPVPAAPTAGANTPLCSGGTLNLTATTVTGATYNWTGPNGFTSSLQNPAVATAPTAATGTYSVTASIAGCTSAAGSVAVSVTPTPVISNAVGTNPATCGGASGSILLSGLPAGAAVTIAYTRNGVAQTASGTVSGTGTFTLSGLTAASYAGFTATAGTCSSAVYAGPVVLSSPTTPAAPAATANSPLCAGGTLALSATAVSGATYSWNGPAGFASTQQNPSIVGAAASNSGTYSVTATVNGCTSPAGTVAVTVNPIPAAPVAANNGPLCAGSTAIFTATTVAGASYAWTGPAGFASTQQNPTLTTTTTASAGTYSVTATVAGCTSAAGTTVLVVQPQPAIATVTGSNPSVCGGTNGSITLTGLIAGVSYNVQFSKGGTAQPAQTLTASGTGQLVLAGLSSGTYGSFAVTANGCTGTSATAVTLSDPSAPAAPAAGSNSPVCVGSALNLTAGTIAGASYNWTGPNGFTATAQNPSVAAATVAATGSYSVTATVAGCTSAAATVTVVVNPIPTAPVAGSNSPVCSGNPLNLTASGITGATYTWTGPNGFSVSSQNPTVPAVTSTASGTYSVTATVAGCTSAAATTAVVVNTTPAAPTASPVAYCQFATASALTATGTNLKWYTTATGGTGSTTAPIPVTTAAGTTTWYVSQTGAGGCESARTPLVVTVNAKPAAPTATTPYTYCQGSAATALTASGTGLLWYTAATGGTGSATAPVPPTATTGTTTFYVSQSVLGCESDRTAVVVTVAPTPVAPTVSTPLSYCQGSMAVPLTATGTNLRWYTTATGGTGSTTAPTPSTATAGTTTWYVSQSIGTCESPRAALVVTVIQALAAPTVTAAVTLCQGSGTQSLAPYATGTGLRWYTTATGGTASTTAPQINTATIGSVTWYVSQSNATCESPRVAITATVTPAPAAPGTVSALYCQFGSIPPLTATGTGTLLWYTSATGGTGQPTLTPNSSVSGTTTYYVSQTVNGCESPRAPLVITIKPQPAAPTVNSPSWCQFGTPGALVAVGQNLLWYTTATGGTGSTATPTLPGTGYGVFNFYVSQTVNGCESPRAAATVTIKQKPAPPVVVTPVVYCQYAPAVPLTAVGQDLLWYSSPAGPGGTPAAPLPSTQYPGAQAYYVSQTVEGCESDRALAAVEVRTQPNATFTASRDWVCVGDTLMFTYFGNGAPTWNYAWQAPLGTTIESGANTQGPVTVRFLEAGRKTIALVVDNGGCISQRVGIDIDVRPRPVVDIRLPANGCVDAPVTVSLDSATRGTGSFTWDFGGGTTPSGTFSGGPYDVVWSTPGIKIVTAIANVNGCPNIPDGDTIEIHERPEARILWDKPARVCANDSLLLLASQAIGNQYAWSPAVNFGGTANAATVWARVPKTQQLRLDVTSQWGCVASDSVVVTTQPCCELLVPNAFTPNGDGRNDEFGIVSQGNYVISTFQVRNRWGQTVWSTATQYRNWDGTLGGAPAPTGTYFYYIRYRCSTGEEFEKAGDVMLIR